MDGKLLGVDIFSGAGGMSVGARMAGIETAIAIEKDKYAAQTYAINHTKTKLLTRDIREVSKNDFKQGQLKASPIILFGGPPCQGFSTSNQRTRNARNPSNWLFKEYIRIVSILKPEWVVFENVKGLVETEHGKFLDAVLNDLSDLKYTLSHWILNATDFGVPQKRARLFIIGSRSGKTIEKPAATHESIVTVDDAIGDLPILVNGANRNVLSYKNTALSQYSRLMRGQLKKCANHLVTNNNQLIVKRYAHIPPGGNWENIPKSLMKNYTDASRCHTGIYHRLVNDAPSVVIGNFRKNMLIHPNQDRGLSVREAARLQSFPDWFEFHGSIGFQQQQVGNAVPPLLAKAVFEAIKLSK